VASGSGTAGYFSSQAGYGLIVENGNVGIGTTTPGEKLTVVGTIESTSGGIKASSTGTAGYFSSQAGYGLIVENGNVGIGTTTPGEKLTVEGTVESTNGGFRFPDGTVQTTASSPTWHQTLQCDLTSCPRFEDVMGGVAVLDKETGLVWEKLPGTSTYAWGTQINRCFTAAIGGRRGWHLPTMEQLSSLVDISTSSPSLPTGHPFLNVQLDMYWTSTTYQNTSGSAWVVNFSDGWVTTLSKGSSTYAWCVRGGQSYDGY
jgi:hypothetical protein